MILIVIFTYDTYPHMILILIFTGVPPFLRSTRVSVSGRGWAAGQLNQLLILPEILWNLSSFRDDADLWDLWSYWDPLRSLTIEMMVTTVTTGTKAPTPTRSRCAASRTSPRHSTQAQVRFVISVVNIAVIKYYLCHHWSLQQRPPQPSLQGPPTTPGQRASALRTRTTMATRDPSR